MPSFSGAGRESPEPICQDDPDLLGHLLTDSREVHFHMLNSFCRIFTKTL